MGCVVGLLLIGQSVFALVPADRVLQNGQKKWDHKATAQPQDKKEKIKPKPETKDFEKEPTEKHEQEEGKNQ
jgi:hypothetical protein